MYTNILDSLIDVRYYQQIFWPDSVWFWWSYITFKINSNMDFVHHLVF